MYVSKNKYICYLNLIFLRVLIINFQILREKTLQYRINWFI